MAEIEYTDVVWTAGDFITEAKLDNMVANDRAVNAMYQGVRFTERADPSTPPANTIHLFGKDKGGVSALYAINDAGSIYEISQGKPTFCFTIPLALQTGTSLAPVLIAPRPLTITKAFAALKGAPTGTAVIFDINKNGGSIWASTQSNRIQVAVGATTGTQTSFDTVVLAEGDILSIDVDQVGSLVTGNDATVELRTE